MNYSELLNNKALVELRPLANKVARIKEHMAGIQRRAASEKANIAHLEGRLAELKGEAGERLTSSAQCYQRFKTEIRELAARLDAARESVRLFEGDVLPGKARELELAQKALDDAGVLFHLAALPACENRMRELLEQVVAEYDGFNAAFAELRHTYGTSFVAPFEQGTPRAAHPRIDGTSQLARGPMWVTFSPPAPASPPDAPQDLQEAPGTPPAPAVDGLNVAPDAQDALPDTAEAAQDALQGPPAAALDTLGRPGKPFPVDWRRDGLARWPPA